MLRGARVCLLPAALLQDSQRGQQAEREWQSWARPSLLPKEGWQELQAPLCSPSLFNIPDICTHLAAAQIWYSAAYFESHMHNALREVSYFKPLSGDVFFRFTIILQQCLTKNVRREVALLLPYVPISPFLKYFFEFIPSSFRHNSCVYCDSDCIQEKVFCRQHQWWL